MLIKLVWITFSAAQFTGQPSAQQQGNRIPFGFYQQAGKEQLQSQGNQGPNIALVPSHLSAQSTLLGTVSFGNPPQPMNILFDTGSGLFWVINAQQCQGIIKGKPGDCPGQYRYLSSYSKTFQPNPLAQFQKTQYFYGGGDIPNTSLNCTIIGFDDLTIGNTLVFKNHPICAADFIKLKESVVYDLPYDGIMGLGPRNDHNLAIVNVVNTFVPKM